MVIGWLEIKKTKIAHSTYDGYKSKANAHVKPKFGGLLLQDLNFTMIEHWRTSELLSLKNKTINEIMIVMRGILKAEKADRIIDYNPCSDVENLVVEHVVPDPFTRSEINSILSTHTTRIQELNMIAFSFWTGLRISELIALSWKDVDLKKGVIKIRRAKVKSKYKVPKTRGSVRDIELLQPAIEALKEQMQHSSCGTARFDPVRCLFFSDLGVSKIRLILIVILKGDFFVFTQSTSINDIQT